MLVNKEIMAGLRGYSQQWPGGIATLLEELSAPIISIKHYAVKCLVGLDTSKTLKDDPSKMKM